MRRATRRNKKYNRKTGKKMLKILSRFMPHTRKKSKVKRGTNLKRWIHAAKIGGTSDNIQQMYTNMLVNTVSEEES